MLIITDRCGQLCNRLFQYANFVAFCKANNLKLVHLGFWDYVQYFNMPVSALPRLIYYPVHLIDYWLCRNIAIFNSFHLLFWKPVFASAGFYNESVFESSLDILKSFRNYKTVFVSGWYFRDSVDFKEYADEIRQLFTPKIYYLLKAKEIVTKIRGKSKILIGLHIRRKDYKFWQHGKYYFNDGLYLRIILEIMSSLPDARFLIASDELLNKENYSKAKDSISWEKREAIIDLLALSQCDYIVGPPSTFSMWASFYGKVPLLFIEEKDQQIDLNKAKVVLSN